MLTPATPDLLPFTLFAFAGALTPGPNNSIAMLTGAHRGMRAVLPHLLGVPAGFALMVALVGLGLGAVLAAKPAWNLALQGCGALYLLYLSWRLANSPVSSNPAAVSFRELGFRARHRNRLCRAVGGATGGGGPDLERCNPAEHWPVGSDGPGHDRAAGEPGAAPGIQHQHGRAAGGDRAGGIRLANAQRAS